jgi:hypothetical protein
VSEQEDLKEIQRVHDEWFEIASRRKPVEDIRHVMAKRDHLIMFNLNGYEYWGIDDFMKLRYYLAENTANSICEDVAPPRIELRGDVAWLTSPEQHIKTAMLTERGFGTPIIDNRTTDLFFRGTELYVRDDGEGRREWRIWHLHYSIGAAKGSPRPGD